MMGWVAVYLGGIVAALWPVDSLINQEYGYVSGKNRMG